MFGYRSARGRCALDLAWCDFPVPEQDVMAILSREGFRVIDADIVGKARRLVSESRYRRGARMVEAPGVVDCSSFVKWLYAERGIWIPRRAIQQRKTGEAVGPGQVIAGDLVFSRGMHGRRDGDDGDAVGHVALATGEGTVIHAANGGAGVVEGPLAPLLAADVSRGIRRIIPSGRRVITLSCPSSWEVETADDIRWIVLQNLPRR